MSGRCRTSSALPGRVPKAARAALPSDKKDKGDQALNRKAVQTDAAPAAIGTYSQAIKNGDLVFLSGQIPLDPATMEITGEDFEARARQVFKNLKAVAEAAGGDLDRIVKVTIYLTDLANFATVNTVMAEYFTQPYPARAAVGVASLPKGADVEAEAILVL